MHPEPAPQQLPQPVYPPTTQPVVVPLSSLLHCAKIFCGVFLVLLFFTSFILQVAGVSKIRKDCKDVEEAFDILRGSSGVEVLDNILDINCEDIARPFWWATFFQSIVVVGIGIAAMLSILRDVRLVMLILLAVTTLQVMDRAEEALDTRNRTLFEREGGQIAAAGYIISAIANLVLLFTVGIKRLPHPQLPRFNMNGNHGQPHTETVDAAQKYPTSH